MVELNVNPLKSGFFSCVTISTSPIYNVMPKIDTHCLVFGDRSCMCHSMLQSLFTINVTTFPIHFSWDLSL